MICKFKFPAITTGSNLHTYNIRQRHQHTLTYHTGRSLMLFYYKTFKPVTIANQTEYPLEQFLIEEACYSTNKLFSYTNIKTNKCWLF